MADCGTPLRAVKDVTVRKVATEAAAGRYIVLHDSSSGEDYVYMHMSAVGVSVGDAVTPATTSARSVRRVTRRPAICTSRSGPSPAGTPADTPRTRSRC